MVLEVLVKRTMKAQRKILLMNYKLLKLMQKNKMVTSKDLKRAVT
jgi:hypothetical protein